HHRRPRPFPTRRSSDLAISPEDTYHLYSVGLVFDEGPLQAQLMLGYQKSEPPGVPDANQGYVSVAYRMGQWTPFATVSFANARSDRKSTRLNSSHVKIS